MSLLHLFRRALFISPGRLAFPLPGCVWIHTDKDSFDCVTDIVILQLRPPPGRSDVPGPPGPRVPHLDRLLIGFSVEVLEAKKTRQIPSSGWPVSVSSSLAPLHRRRAFRLTAPLRVHIFPSPSTILFPLRSQAPRQPAAPARCRST